LDLLLNCSYLDTLLRKLMTSVCKLATAYLTSRTLVS
jgi:hypothetical protein